MLLEPRDLEQLVIGACVASGNSFDAISDLLKSDHFSDPWCRRAWATMQDVALRLQPWRLDFLAHRMGEPDDGARLTVARQRGADDAGMVQDYAETIISAWQRRELIAESQRLAKAAESDTDPHITAYEAGERMTALLGASRRDEATLAELARQVVRETEAQWRRGVPDGLSTGLHTLDELTGPLQPDDKIVLLGDTGDGKTTLAMQIAMHVARRQWVDFYALDQSGRAIAQKAIAALSGLTLGAMRDARFPQADMERIVVSLNEIARAKVRVMRSRFIEDIKAHSLAHARREGLGLVIVDHAKRVLTREKVGGAVERVAHTVNQLPELVEAWGCPVIMLAQRTREAIKRDDPTPRVHDIWGGGDVNEVADIVLAMWQPARNEVWREMQRRRRKDSTDPDAYGRSREGMVEMILRKHRGAAPDTRAWMRFDGAAQRLEEVETKDLFTGT